MAINRDNDATVALGRLAQPARQCQRHAQTGGNETVRARAPRVQARVSPVAHAAAFYRAGDATRAPAASPRARKAPGAIADDALPVAAGTPRFAQRETLDVEAASCGLNQGATDGETARSATRQPPRSPPPCGCRAGMPTRSPQNARDRCWRPAAYRRPNAGDRCLGACAPGISVSSSKRSSI
jgi:hypothetical protein